MTNYERIKQMDIKDLATLLMEFNSCSQCRSRGNTCFPYHNIDSWLEQEVEPEKEVEPESSEDCPYCHLDESLECSQEWFSHPNGMVEIGVCCADGVVNLIYKSENEESAMQTSAKYCPYCGRKLAID